MPYNEDDKHMGLQYDGATSLEHGKVFWSIWDFKLKLETISSQNHKWEMACDAHS